MRGALILLAWLMLAGEVYAQDALFTLPEADPMAGLLEEIPEDPLPQTKKAALDLYLKNCMAQKDEFLAEDHRIGLCLCTAGFMEQRFDEPSLKTMFADTKKGQELRDMAVIHAFAPCMHGTAYDLTFDSCRGSAEFAKLPNKDAICTCTAQGVRYNMAGKEEWMAGQYVQYRKDLAPDPLRLYLQGRDYSDDFDYNLSRCRLWHRKTGTGQALQP